MVTSTTIILTRGAGEGNLLTVGIALCALLASLAAIWFGLRSANRTLLQSQMEAYIAAYVAASESRQIVHTVAEYQRCSAARKLVMQLLVARLIGIVDLMNRTGDRRRYAWTYYMTVIRGPLGDTGAHLETYAAHGRTKRDVQRAQQSIRANPNTRATTPEPVGWCLPS